ncbi:MAG TPA: MFS transporter [Rhizomicrobium sp.]|jgi:FSR family fosmidomycin resistance protein-like MFS transporter|nr:MFS transporter [Rhizomicrobium sp.]
MTETALQTPASAAAQTTFTVLFAISFCHLLNDMMQAVLPAIYPTLKLQFHLSFVQVGLITTAFQCTASLLQPAVGFASDIKPMPYSLSIGMVSTFVGLILLSVAGSYAAVLTAAVLVGLGSSVFHPESARVARMASGGRHGLAQSLFQVGGNTGSALGPLSAAFVVAWYGQRGVAWYCAAALLAMIVLFQVGNWYKHHGLARINAAKKPPDVTHPRGKVMASVVILLLLVFSKYFYLTSINTYLTFYLIHTFGVSVQNAQVHLFLFLGAVAAGTFMGGPLGDRFGRKYVIWFSILGMLPFTLMLPYANLFWTGVLTVVIGIVVASAFPAIIVYAQELLPGKLGMISGLFYGFAFGMGGIGAALLGELADATSITFVYKICAFLPAIGLLTVFLPDLKTAHR